MANAPTKPDAGDQLPAEAGPIVIRKETVAAYEAMIASVPDAGGDGMTSILEAIARGTDVADLDAPWRSSGLEDWLNVPIVVTGIRKLPSDFAGGLPWFLVIDGAVRSTGEVLAITTGAVSVVAQLVKAHQLGGFPLTVIPRQAERPSANGYYPQHLEIVR